MATVQGKLWFAIRQSEAGNEWIDLSTCGSLLVIPQEKTQTTDECLPQWAKANPVIRYAQFRLVEIVD